MGNKQQLQLNNETLASILSDVLGLPSQESLKHGAYVWKKLTAQGGDFVDFVVSDSPTTYPDGGEQGGYWYEKVVEGMPLEILGCTKFAIDSITFSADTADTDLYLQHSLGEIPKFAILISDATLFTTNIGVMSFILKQGRKHWYGAFEYSFGSDNATIASYNTTSDGYHTAEKIRVQQSGTVRYFRAGVEYTLITMA